MSRREIAALACKLLALWVLAQGVSAVLAFVGSCLVILFSMPQSTSNGQAVQTILAGFIALAVPGGIGLFLWLGASKLAGLMVSDDLTPVRRSDITNANVLSLAFTVIGVVTLLSSAEQLIGAVVRGLQGGGHYSPAWDTFREDSRFWSAIFGIGISLWLILRPREIVRMLERAKESPRGDMEDQQAIASPLAQSVGPQSDEEAQAP